MTIRKPAPSTAVKLIREAFQQAQGQTLSTKNAYELLARLEGFKDWATASTVLAKTASKAGNQPQPKIGYLSSEIENWPVYVVCTQEEDSGGESYYVLPQGVLLDDCVHRYGEVDEAHAKPMPNIFEGQNIGAKELAAKILQTFVVTDTFSLVGRPEKYGLPYYANELGVGDWAVESLGWNYLAYDSGKGVLKPAVEVNFYDTGDDGMGRYWLQIAVEPSAAVLLEAALANEAEVTLD